MKFAVVVHGAPYSSQSALSALHFCRAVLEQGHELYRVFFYHDGVHNGSSLMAPPQDEPDLGAAWQELSAHTDLVICIASSLRRGLLDETEARRYEKESANLADGFDISGLGQLIDGALTADRTVSFGA